MQINLQSWTGRIMRSDGAAGVANRRPLEPAWRAPPTRASCSWEPSRPATTGSLASRPSGTRNRPTADPVAGPVPAPRKGPQACNVATNQRDPSCHLVQGAKCALLILIYLCPSRSPPLGSWNEEKLRQPVPRSGCIIGDPKATAGRQVAHDDKSCAADHLQAAEGCSARPSPRPETRCRPGTRMLTLHGPSPATPAYGVAASPTLVVWC